MKLDANIYVAGHTEIVGSAIVMKLETLGYFNLIKANHSQFDLLKQKQVEDFFMNLNPILFL